MRKRLQLQDFPLLIFFLISQVEVTSSFLGEPEESVTVTPLKKKKRVYKNSQLQDFPLFLRTLGMFFLFFFFFIERGLD